MKKELIESKYGDDTVFESWADNNIMIPLTNKLVDPLYNIGLTPNMVTIASTIFTLSTIYFLHTDKNIYAGLAYFVGALLDSVDGRMARKYKMTSIFGMVLDLVSDNLSNLILLIYILLYKNQSKYFKIIIIVVLILTYMLSISYGINEAHTSYLKTGDDNFYKLKLDEIKKNNLTGIIYDLYLYINKKSYEAYKKYFPEYNETKLFKYLKLLKEFGPGNYCVLVSIIIGYL